MQVDVAVVGLGLVGTAVLRELAERGVLCAGIGPGEPVELAEHRGVFASHYDSGRITRRLDARWEWALLATRSIDDYARIEAASAMTFHRPVGALLGELDAQRITATTRVASQLGVPMTITGPAGTENGSPPDSRVRFPPGATIFAEPAPAGHVDPRRMLAANLAIATSLGATVVPEEVVAVRRRPDSWRVETQSGESVDARRVVITTGPHTDELESVVGLPPLSVRGETILLATLGDEELARLSGLPSVLARLDHSPYGDLYLVPPTPYPDGRIRLKMGATLRSPNRLDSGGDRRAWMAGDDHRREQSDLVALLADLLPDLATTSLDTRPCLITDTDSGLPYVDHLDHDLVVAVGGNGYAAKSANAIGRLATDLALNDTWIDLELDRSAFAVG